MILVIHVDHVDKFVYGEIIGVSESFLSNY